MAIHHFLEHNQPTENGQLSIDKVILHNKASENSDLTPKAFI
jgi:hypothetical protein